MFQKIKFEESLSKSVYFFDPIRGDLSYTA